MLGRILSVSLVLVVGLITLVSFQNCSSSGLPDELSKLSQPPAVIRPEAAIAPASVEVGKTIAVTVNLKNFKKNHTLTWAVMPADGNFQTTSGSLNVVTDQETATISLESKAAAGSGNKFYTLIVYEPSEAMDRVMATVSVVDPTPASSLSVGYLASCASVNGVAKCWGDNPYGELGTNDTTDRDVPSPVLGLPSGVAVLKVAHGVQTSCALMVGGALYCWGRNDFGGLGDGSTSSSRGPRLVAGMESGVTDVAIGWMHTCAVKNMKLFCWGRNDYGQLGLNDTTNRSAATEVTALGTGVTAVAAGQHATCAIVFGAVKCFGRNDNRQLGDGTQTNRRTPVAVAGADQGVTSVAIGTFHACAVVNGAVKCWGYNGNGQLGDNSTTNRAVATPVTGLSMGASQVVTGDQHTCAIVNGGVKCWGINDYGNLGVGDTNRRLSPIDVVGLNAGVLQISSGTGGSHSCAFTTTGLRCWGRNGNGQLGDDSVTQRNAAVLINF